MKAADEPAYLTVGTDVSAKYRGAFCEAKIKTVKRLVKVKVILKQDNSTQLVQDDQVKGPLRVGAIVETKTPDGSFQEAIISKLTDASWYTVVFDDGDERTLRRTSLCLKGERHFAESETLDQLPLTNPEHFGTPVIGKKSNRGRRSSLPVTEDEKEEESSEEEDEDKRRLNDELLGKVVSVSSTSEKSEWYPALVISPSCNDDIMVKKDQCLVRSFADSKFYSIARKDIKEVDILSLPESELSTKPGLQKASTFLKTKVVPDNWKMDISEILESSSSDDEDGANEESDEEKDKENAKEEEEMPEEELDPEERDNFLQQLYKFMEDRGTPINKPPVLGYKDLNLFKLFRLVYHQGGCDNIDSGAVWKQIYMDLGIPILNSAASYNVKTAYRKYLYGFEEYCRSANIQFRTIHHNEPKVIEQIKKIEESMEETVKVEQEMPLVEVKSETEENIDSNSESEKEEVELKSPRGRRRIARDITPAKKENEEEKTEDKLRDNNKENKDIEEESEIVEKKENETLLGRKSTPKPKEKKIRKQEESDKDSDEEEEKRRERYDEWVKADRIIWPLDKGGPKRKQKKKTKNKEDIEKDEKKDEERQKSKRGRPPLKSTLPSNMSYGVSKSPNIEGKMGARSARSSLPDSSPLTNGMEDSASSDSEMEDTSDKNLVNEELSPEIIEELEKSEKFIDDKVEEENPQFPHVLKENDRTQVQPLETLKLEVEESEQIVQIFGNKMEQVEDIKKETEKSPKGKGRKNKTKDLSLETIKISPLSQDEARSESYVEPLSLEVSSLESKEFSSTTEDEMDSCTKEKKLKRKISEQSSPEKKIRVENEMEVPDLVSEERTNDYVVSEELKELNSEEQPEMEHEEMPSLIAESEEQVKDVASENFDFPSEETENVVVKEEEEDVMPLIGPETLVCHEVDLDDLDEKDKNSADEAGTETLDPVSPVPNPPAMPPAAPPGFSAPSPLALSQEESRSIKSESDITIEVDSVAEESQEGLCESESANGFEASTTSSTCSVTAQEREVRDKGQKRQSDGNGGSLAKKQKRPPKRTSATVKNEKNGTGQSSDSEDLPVPDSTSKCTPVKHIHVAKPPKLARSPARMMSPHIKDGDKEKHRDKHQNSSPRAYKWSFQLNELDNMNSTERISFLQEKLQEIRKYYMSLKSEVATIDRRRKRLKKKDREVSHAGASMSSASSDTGMSPSSSSPPQNVLAVECR
uniref:AT-rich interactive domain-containing protein 4A n=1 Tax=Monodelphis domestica TaxID=13616 RepID=A0A5F8H082_MONDO